ncbi:MAG: hypothetical protein HZA14_06685 [Nitrospirae bacterium]|nr:hypothetical protein [Nitrospirota bacterium]
MKRSIPKILLLIIIALSYAEPAYSFFHVQLLYVIDSGFSKTDYLVNPSDIFFDEVKKELYVTDVGKHRILVFDSNGRLSAELKEIEGIKTPISIVVDKKGMIYLIDAQLSNVTVLDYQGRLIDVFDKDYLFSGESTKPYRLFKSHDDGIYLMSSNTRLYKIDPDSHKVAPFKLNIDPNKPELVMVLTATTDSSGNIYFGDMRPGQVVVFDGSGNYLKRIGEPGGGDRQISRPTGVAVDKEGRTFVVSTIRHMVLCYDSDGRFVWEFGGMGTSPGYFYLPTKIVSDGENRLYVLDASLKRVQVFEVN